MIKKLIKFSAIILFWLILGPKIVHAEKSTLLIFDVKQNSILPEHFRFSSALHAAGGSQFTKTQLEKIAKILGKSAVVVDLRQESHGFVAGIPISWYGPKDWANVKLTDAQIETKEQKQLNTLAKEKTISVNKILKKDGQGFTVAAKKVVVKVNDVSSEQVLVEKLGLRYQRFFITDHRAPNDQEINRFVNYIKKLPVDTNIYFHCHAGVGRTTTFMVMYDIMRNAKKISLNTIIKRQAALGGKDLQEITVQSSYKYPYQVERYHFIQSFYNYVKTNTDNFATSWFAWKNAQNR